MRVVDYDFGVSCSGKITHLCLPPVSKRNQRSWWESPDEAVARPKRIIAQVMNMGDYTDVQIVAHLLGDQGLREILFHAEPGQFNERSWAYWHYRLGLAEIDCVPSLPTRRFL